MQGLAKGQLLLDKVLNPRSAQALLDFGELLSVPGAKGGLARFGSQVH